jgi:hypothetical protein
MQALIEPLARDLPAFVDGYVAGARRQRGGRPDRRLLGKYIDATARMRELIEAQAKAFGATHHSYLFDVGAATHLRGHASDYTQALLSFHNRRVAPSLVVEEAHTFAEAILRACTDGERAQTFAAQAESAVRLGAASNDGREALIRLKDRRRGSKHQNRRITFDDAAHLLNEANEALHLLLHYLRRRAGGELGHVSPEPA